MLSNSELELINQLKHERALNKEKILSPYATKDSEAIRKYDEPEDFRLPFALDRDRILYSGAYRRYSGKTQVIYFSSIIDEEITSRNIHTTYVSQTARTIGGMLSLNLELIEAIAIGHDLGHTPFGHDGETFLSKLCVENKIGHFHHNIHSYYIVENIARKGLGLNLTLQVRDGILSHDGEVHNTQVKPEKSKTQHDLDIYCEKRIAGEKYSMMPMTIEGSVVRVSDTIAYIGQDIEDAIRLGLIKREDIPIEITDKIGSANRDILKSLTFDVVIQSYQKDYVKFSDEVSEMLQKLKKFNYERIYLNPKVKLEQDKIEKAFQILFYQYLEDLEKGIEESRIFKHFLNGRTENYMTTTPNSMKVRDFIASMTDRYFLDCLNLIIFPAVRSFS